MYTTSVHSDVEHAGRHARFKTHILNYTSARTYPQALAYTHTHPCTCTHTHTHAYTRTHIHTHTHSRLYNLPEVMSAKMYLKVEFVSALTHTHTRARTHTHTL